MNFIIQLSEYYILNFILKTDFSLQTAENLIKMIIPVELA